MGRNRRCTSHLFLLRGGDGEGGEEEVKQNEREEKWKTSSNRNHKVTSDFFK